MLWPAIHCFPKRILLSLHDLVAGPEAEVGRVHRNVIAIRKRREARKGDGIIIIHVGKDHVLVIDTLEGAIALYIC